MDVVALAQDLMRCPSVTPHDAGVMAVLSSALEKLGFTCHRVTFADAPGEPTENLYARLGTQAPNLCFAGHVDVVPPGDEAAWSQPPFGAVVKDGYLIGRGAEDMKGAIAAFVAGVAAYLQAGGETARGSISLLITGDEEGVSINGTKQMLPWLRARGEVLDACIVGEPTNPHMLGEMAKIGRRGSAYGVVTVEGKQGHVAYPDLAENPVPLLINALTRLLDAPLDAGSAYFPPSRLEVTSIDVGNMTGNVIPAQATARFNIRFNDQHSAESLERWVRARLEESGARYQLVWRVSGVAFLTPPGRLSTVLLEAVQEVLGMTPTLSTTGGTSDARFIKDLCPVVEFGTTGSTAHAVDEKVKVKDLHDLTAIYTAMLRRYFSV